MRGPCRVDLVWSYSTWILAAATLTFIVATLVKPGLLLTCGFATKAFLVAMRLLIRDFFSIAI